MARMVHCVKLGREAPGLEAPPFPGEFGQRVFENISEEAYEMWKEHQTIIINHYGLHPADPETRRMLRAEMEEFFFGENAQVPEGWVDPNAPSSKGGGAEEQAPADKGAPAQKK